MPLNTCVNCGRNGPDIPTDSPYCSDCRSRVARRAEQAAQRAPRKYHSWPPQADHYPLGRLDRSRHLLTRGFHRLPWLLQKAVIIAFIIASVLVFHSVFLMVVFGGSIVESLQTSGISLLVVAGVGVVLELVHRVATFIRRWYHNRRSGSENRRPPNPSNGSEVPPAPSRPSTEPTTTSRPAPSPALWKEGLTREQYAGSGERGAGSGEQGAGNGEPRKQ